VILDVTFRRHNHGVTLRERGGQKYDCHSEANNGRHIGTQ
jgi:hypothetical protein